MSSANRNILQGLTMGAGGVLAHVAISTEPNRTVGIGGRDPGPRDLFYDQQNLDLINPPSTDHGTLPNLRFSFADSHVRQESGGWSREITEHELGVSKGITGVNIRLNTGGIPELHWHEKRLLRRQIAQSMVGAHPAGSAEDPFELRPSAHPDFAQAQDSYRTRVISSATDRDRGVSPTSARATNPVPDPCSANRRNQ